MWLQHADIFKHTSCKSCCEGADRAHASNPGKTLWTSTSSGSYTQQGRMAAGSNNIKRHHGTHRRGTLLVASASESLARQVRPLPELQPRHHPWMTAWVILTRPEQPHHSWPCLSHHQPRKPSRNPLLDWFGSSITVRDASPKISFILAALAPFYLAPIQVSQPVLCAGP